MARLHGEHGAGQPRRRTDPDGLHPVRPATSRRRCAVRASTEPGVVRGVPGAVRGHRVSGRGAHPAAGDRLAASRRLPDRGGATRGAASAVSAGHRARRDVDGGRSVVCLAQRGGVASLGGGHCLQRGAGGSGDVLGRVPVGRTLPAVGGGRCAEGQHAGQDQQPWCGHSSAAHLVAYLRAAHFWDSGDLRRTAHGLLPGRRAEHRLVGGLRGVPVVLGGSAGRQLGGQLDRRPHQAGAQRAR